MKCINIEQQSLLSLFSGEMKEKMELVEQTSLYWAQFFYHLPDKTPILSLSIIINPN